MENKLKNVLSIVFNVDINKINNESSPDSIPNWDSLAHMNLVVALEEEFDVEFNDDEINEMLNYALIKEILNNKI
jgi:acyl carrier protein